MSEWTLSTPIMDIHAAPEVLTRGPKNKVRGAPKRKKRSKKEGARAYDNIHVNGHDHHPNKGPEADIGGHSDGQSQVPRRSSSGQGKRTSAERDRDTDSDGDASLKIRLESPHGHQPSEGSSDSGKGGTAVDKDDSEEDLGQRDASDSEELMQAHHQPPSHQISSGESEYSPNEAESSDSPVRQSVQEPVLTGDDSGQPSSQRKRKAPAEAPKVTGFRPLKKAKGSFNRAYLDILNEDIEHAAAQYVPLGRKTKDGRMGLPSSQIGMVIWTSMEKERFFEALGRLGRDDSPGIARRIRTKGEMEVRQYLMLLQDGLAQRRQQNELDPMELADFPAAAELSHECCEALDEVADSLAWRQESFEQSTEQHKHGPDWLVTQESCNDANQDKAVDDDLKPSSVLNTSKWLQISERLFMNGTSAERNWRSVDGDHPSIRRTTRDDFYSLALTLTRRLVAATIFIASSRIRTESGYNANKQSEVRRKDVRAAVLSLGLRTEKQTVLAGSARRLGLHVYEHPPKPSEEEDKATSMPYDAIEHALGMSGHRNISSIRRKIQRIEMSPDEDNTPVSPYSPAYSEVETGSVDSDDDYTYDGFKDEEDEDEDVRAEADEIILYSAVDQPQTKRDRETLFRRIKADREQESYADAVDAQATYQEEKRMWEVLGKQPPQPLVDPGLPPAGRRLKVSVDAAYSVGKNWRAHTKVASEWEMSTPTAWMRNYYAA